jgi:beta-lactamase class A
MKIPLVRIAALTACAVISITPTSASARASSAPSKASRALPAADLHDEVKRIAASTGAKVGVSIVHLESGNSAAIAADKALPLFSVYKLALAVAVLKEVEAGRLALDRSVTITASDVAPGVGPNADRWKAVPATFTIKQLLEFSLMESDNTSSDKLLTLLDGPAAVTKRLRALGVTGIDLRGGTHDVLNRPDHPNLASPKALTDLLASLHAGRLLAPAEKAVLWDFLGRSRTGLNRIRGLLPIGTPVIDKTGTGRTGTATNDVGIITLPDNRGHLALAVLIIGSKRPLAEQERAIAEIARAAFNIHTAKQQTR